MACLRCGTVFCWDEADVATLGGARKLYCGGTCKRKHRALLRKQRERREQLARERARHRGQLARERQLALCQEQKKRKFSTRPEARLAARMARHRNKSVRLRPYECACGWWHLTSGPVTQANTQEGGQDRVLDVR